MKRSISVIISIVMVLSLCACGASENTKTKPSAGMTASRKIEKQTADTLEGVLAVISDDYGTTIQALQDSLEKINTLIDGDYGSYIRNRQMIDDWYTQAETETAELFQRTEENCRQYFILMSTQTEHEYKAMSKAAEKIYDDVYDDARDDFYDDVYDELMEDLYDEYYDGVLDDAYDLVPYKEYSEQRSYCYQVWSEARSALYSLYSEYGSRLYEMYSAINRAIYDEEYDFAAVLKGYDTEQTQKFERADITQSADAAEEADRNNTSAAADNSISPEFKKAMDSYEAFFSEYAEFVQEFSDNPSDLSLLTKYIDYMDRYTETMEALEDIGDDELTTAELSYYIEVMGRIQQMLLSAAG